MWFFIDSGNRTWTGLCFSFTKEIGWTILRIFSSGLDFGFSVIGFSFPGFWKSSELGFHWITGSTLQRLPFFFFLHNLFDYWPETVDFWNIFDDKLFGLWFVVGGLGFVNC